MTDRTPDELTRLLWAKSDPFHFLWRHLLDAAAVCHVLLPRFWPDAPIPAPWLLYLVALHDIGKADALFQLKHEESARNLPPEILTGIDLTKVQGFRHEARSANFLEAHLKAHGWGSAAISTVTAAIRGHHGNFQAKFITDEYAARWEPIREELTRCIAEVVGPLPVYAPENFTDENASRIGLLLSGLIVLCDWIASNDQMFYSELVAKGAPDNPSAYFEAACKRAEKVIAKLELDAPEQPYPSAEPLRFAEVWPAFAPRPMQTALESVLRNKGGIAPGLAIIEDAMGGGKTEAAVYLAEEWNRQWGRAGVYIALPTQATSNQMHTRYRAYITRRSPEQAEPRLVHGMAWLRDKQTPETAPLLDDDRDAAEAQRALEWFAPAKRALLAPEAVGTIDQALLAAMNVRHGFLRLFGLSRRTLVIDEVHACSPYMSTLLHTLLQWCRALKIPVILLSATLSHTQKERLVQAYQGNRASLPASREYPLLTFAPLEGEPVLCPVFSDKAEQPEPRTVKIVREPGRLGDPVAIAQLAAELVQKGGCVCVLLNTVRTAQETYEALATLKETLPENTERYLFHARFPADRRDDIEKEVIKRFGPNEEDKTLPNPERPKHAILIATQVVEQSLDVDFDVFVTEIAPIDLLLQRSGRLHRHDANKGLRYGHGTPELHILLPSLPIKGEQPFGATQIVYPLALLLRTLALLSEARAAFKLPMDFRDLIEACYGHEPLPALTDGVTAEAIAVADTEHEKAENDLQQLARGCLITFPDPEEFGYGQEALGLDEADESEGKSGDAARFLTAKTRHGDDTRAVLVLSDRNLINAFLRDWKRTAEKAAEGNHRWSPHPEVLKRIFARKASVPKWWLTATAAEGYKDFFKPDKPEDKSQKFPKWLRHHVVLIMPEGEWHGHMPGKKDIPAQTVVLHNDMSLGLVLIGLKNESVGEAETSVV
jgi:CRISPR-associated endonuclease/helicase Cas3